MKKILIIIIVISVYLHFYPQPELTRWYEETKSAALFKLHNLSKVKFKADLDKSYKEWMKEFIHFSDQEKQNLKEIMVTHKSASIFYNTHCLVKSEEKFFYGENHKKVCSKLSIITK